MTRKYPIMKATPQQILEAVGDFPVTLFYPRQRYTNALVGTLLEDSTLPLYYYRVEDGRLTDFLRNIAESPVFPEDFGKNSKAMLRKFKKFPELGDAFAHDLAALTTKDYILFLDEFDKLHADYEAVEAFLRTLIPQIPKNARLIINGRELFRQPFHDMREAGHVQVVGEHDTIGTGAFGGAAKQGHIEFFALAGEDRILSDGRTVKSWDGALPKLLAYYIIDKQMVTRNEIFEIFWPHLGIKEATNVFHVTKRKISEKLGHDITTYETGFYVYSSGVHIMYDAREFEQSIDAAESLDLSAALPHYRRAISLYRHPFLATLDMPWMIEKRESLRSKYAQALIALGRSHLADNETERALAYFLRAVQEKPEREDVHRNILQLYMETGRIEDLIEHYRAFERLLKRAYNIAPSAEVRELYEKARQH